MAATGESRIGVVRSTGGPCIGAVAVGPCIGATVGPCGMVEKSLTMTYLVNNCNILSE